MSLIASWIGSSTSQGEKEQYVRFRRTVVLAAQPASATVRISADSRYRLCINGQCIGFGPSRSYPHHQCADSHEVATALQPGENVIAVMVYQPGYSHYSYACRDTLGLWLTLEVDGEPVLVSDDSWKTSHDLSYSSEARRISIYGAGQEVRDLRLAEPWMEANYDDDTWAAATTVTEGPWAAMATAPLVNLVESVVLPTLATMDVGSYVANEDPHEVMRSAFLSSALGHEQKAKAPNWTRPPFDKSSTPEFNCTSQNLLEVPAFSAAGTLPQSSGIGSKHGLPVVVEGDVLLLCYDFGHSQAGSANLYFQGALGGEEILISYLEKEKEGQLVLSDPSTYCEMRMTDSFVLAPGENHAEPFTPRGGRFLLLGLVGTIPPGLSVEIKFLSRHYPLELTREISPNDSVLQEVAEMCWRTLQACALDGMVDCPWREQASWVGDSAITAGVVAELCDDSCLLRRMLELASQGAWEDGVLPGVVTHESDSTAVLAYSFAWVEGLSKYHSISADTDFVLQQWNALSRMLSRFQQDLDSDSLLIPQLERRHFLDWAELPTSEPSCLYNLRYLYALQLAASLASRLDRPVDARRWQEGASLLSAAIRSKFFQAGKWYDDTQGSSRSQHVAAFLTLTGLAGEEEASRLLSEAVGCSLEEEDNELVRMSPYMHYYLFLALQQIGRNEDLLNIVKHRWSLWLARGARTTWENWEVDFPDGSQCHAWSAHPLLFIAQLAE